MVYRKKKTKIRWIDIINPHVDNSSPFLSLQAQKPREIKDWQLPFNTIARGTKTELEKRNAFAKRNLIQESPSEEPAWKVQVVMATVGALNESSLSCLSWCFYTKAVVWISSFIQITIQKNYMNIDNVNLKIALS